MVMSVTIRKMKDFHNAPEGNLFTNIGMSASHEGYLTGSSRPLVPLAHGPDEWYGVNTQVRLGSLVMGEQ